MRAWFAPLAVAIVVLAPIAASAATLEGTLSTTGRATFLGTGAISAASGQLYLDPGRSESVFDAHCDEGHLELWNYPREETRIRADGEELLFGSRALEPRRQGTVPATSVLFDPSGTSAAFVGVSFEGQWLHELASGPLKIWGPAAGDSRSMRDPLQHVTDVEGVAIHAISPGIWFESPGRANLTIDWDAAWVLAVHGYIPSVDGSDLAWPSGQNLNSTESVVDPATGSGRFVFDTWFSVLHCSAGSLYAADSMALRGLTDRVKASLDGDMTWVAVESSLRLDDQLLAPDNHILQVFGVLDTDVAPTQAALQWDISGQVTGLRADTEPLLWATLAGGSVGLGLLIVFWTHVLAAFKSVATCILGSRTPRLVKADVLASGTRVAILREIHRSQVVTVPILMDRTRRGRNTIRYHIRVLKAHDIVQEHVGTGRTKVSVYALNSDSLRIPLREPPTEDGGATATGGERQRVLPGAPQSLAAIRTHPIRTSLFETIVARPGSTIAELQDSVSTGENGGSRERPFLAISANWSRVVPSPRNEAAGPFAITLESTLRTYAAYNANDSSRPLAYSTPCACSGDVHPAATNPLLTFSRHPWAHGQVGTSAMPF